VHDLSQPAEKSQCFPFPLMPLVPSEAMPGLQIVGFLLSDSKANFPALHSLPQNACPSIAQDKQAPSFVLGMGPAAAEAVDQRPA
jgi:hypothetical protein